MILDKKISSTRCAIVHDSILEFGGAERVLQTFLKIFPNADVYTLVADNSLISFAFPNLKKEKLHVILNGNYFRSGSVQQLLAPFLWKKINFEDYELVISSSAYLLSNTIFVSKPAHIQYIHCPPKNIFGLSKKTRLQNLFDYSYLIKKRYIQSLHSSPNILVNSQYTKKILWTKFKVYSTVIYPPVTIPKYKQKVKKSGYFLSVSRFNKAKNIDKIIYACNALKIPLKIVGTGNDSVYAKKLRLIAGPTIEFLGFVNDNELAAIYRSATGFICASEGEDFGITAIEAQAHGVPVLAFYGGGFKETILPNKTGLFFYKNSVDKLIIALKKFAKLCFNSHLIYTQAIKFREERFIDEIKIYTLLLLEN